MTYVLKERSKQVWGSFEGRLGGRTSKLPQSDFIVARDWF
jgi:hypothetical protein